MCLARRPRLAVAIKLTRAPLQPKILQHGTFKQHLLGVWKILSVWEQPQALARCGLFHSAYSNSYVNLAIFKAGVDRGLVKEDCGAEAEDLIYKFCGACVYREIGSGFRFDSILPRVRPRRT